MAHLHTRRRIAEAVNSSLYIPSASINSTITTSVDGATGTVFSWSHEVLDAANRYMILAVSIRGYGSIVSASFNSSPLTFIQRSAENSGEVAASELWGLVAPDVGTYTFALETSVEEFWTATVIDFKNVHQTTPLGTPISNTYGLGYTASGSLETTLSDLMIGVLSRGNATFTLGQGIERWDLSADTNWKGCGFTSVTGTGTAPISISMSASVKWALSAVPLKRAEG